MCALLLVGCVDRAELPYNQCQEEEAKQEFYRAIESCEEAAKKDPNSASGRAAKAKLPDLREKETRKNVAAREAKEAREKAERDEAYRREQAEFAACKAQRWVTFCEGGGGLIGASTKAQCEHDAKGFMSGFKTRCALPCKCADNVLGAN